MVTATISPARGLPCAAESSADHGIALAVGAASAVVVVSTICRGVMLGADPVFEVAAPVSTPGPAFDALTLVPGLTGGLLAIGATAMAYFAEDLFARLAAAAGRRGQHDRHAAQTQHR
jgi:hypothetical protein